VLPKADEETRRWRRRRRRRSKGDGDVEGKETETETHALMPQLGDVVSVESDRLLNAISTHRPETNHIRPVHGLNMASK
jgi:hypothetical protein